MPKAKTGGLGRGLDSLFGSTAIEIEPVSITAPENTASGKAAPKKPASTEIASGETVVYLKLSDIKPNAKQPRKVFDEAALDDLASSISEHGVIQPVLVRPSAKGYELVAGERRWRAARKAGLKTIPAIVRELDEKQNMFYALIENVQREDLNSIEEAKGIKEIMDAFGINQEEASQAVGKSRSYVANSLRLLKLPEEIQQLVMDGKLSAGHARAIAGLKGEKLQNAAAAKAVDEGWSVRQIENYTGEVSKKKPTKRVEKKNNEVAAVEERLSALVGTKVAIKGSDKKGSVVIEYYSREELDHIIDLFEK